jgi:hypothetical protein
VPRSDHKISVLLQEAEEYGQTNNRVRSVRPRRAQVNNPVNLKIHHISAHVQKVTILLVMSLLVHCGPTGGRHAREYQKDVMSLFGNNLSDRIEAITVDINGRVLSYSTPTELELVHQKISNGYVSASDPRIRLAQRQRVGELTLKAWYGSYATPLYGVEGSERLYCIRVDLVGDKGGGSIIYFAFDERLSP